MKQKKIITVIGIISLLIFGGIIANIFIMNTKQNLSETNTTEFLGTVKNVATTGTGGDEYGVLCTMEYEAKLYIYHINDFIDTSEFINLQPGQLIYFRIENAWLDTFDEINFVNIVSLRTNEKDLISLNNYIKFEKISKQFLDLTLCNSANGGKACIYGLFRHLLYGRTIRI